jgi:hypothetical protein
MPARSISPEKARARVTELDYVLNHPDEDPLTDEQVRNAREEFDDLKRYLAAVDETL